MITIAKWMICIIFASLLAKVSISASLDEQARQDLKKSVKLQDLAYGEILYDYYRGDEISALNHIFIAQKQKLLPNHANRAELLSGVIYLNLGMLAKAQIIFNRLLTKEDLQNELLAKIEFYLAKLHYKQGDYPQADKRLKNIYSVLDASLKDESLIMLSNIALANNQLIQARDWLNQISKDSELLAYSRYNLGILWLKEGNLTQALPFLGKVYTNKEPTNVQRSLQDKAKVALGYHYLKAKEFEKSREQFLSVRLKSAYTNKALLGAGWSYVEAGNYNKALSHWLELGKKDIRDIAVQEALLAIPYAYQKLDSMTLSLDSYLHASDIYQKQIKLIERIEKKISKGQLIKKIIRKMNRTKKRGKERNRITDSQLFGEDYDYYIYELIAQNDFNEDYRSYQKLDQLYLMLEHWEKQLPMFSEMLNANQLSFDKKIPRVDAYLELGVLNKYQMMQQQIEDELSAIKRSEKLHLLANPEQKKLHERIQRLEKRLQIIPPEMISAKQLDKLRIAKGILQWQFESDKAGKIWELQKGRDEVGVMLKTMQRQTKKLSSAREYALSRFVGYQSLVDKESQRLKDLQSRINAQVDYQAGNIKEQILSVLNKRKVTLEYFLLQSDLAVARLHEQALNIPEFD